MKAPVSIRLFTGFFLTHTGLLVMLLLVFFAPLFRGSSFGRISFHLAMSAAFIAGLLLLHQQTRQRLIALVLAALALTSRWLEPAWGSSPAVIAGEFFAALFFVYVAWSIFKQMLKASTITADTVSAAISLYLLIGIIFALLFACIDSMWTGSFHFPVQEAASARDTRAFLYFSFVTLTTLGFGDTVPVSDVARSFTILEAICGQMYIAVILATTVGKLIAHSGDRRTK